MTLPAQVDDATSDGLSAAEAARRLQQFGPNELAVRDRRAFLRVLWEALREPLLLLLIGTTAFYLAIGDWHEGALLAVLTVVDLGIVEASAPPGLQNPFPGGTRFASVTAG